MKTTGPGQPFHMLLDVAALLTELGIPYAAVGGLAVSFHGSPRATHDADAVIWLRGTGKTEQDLVRRLTNAGYRTILRRGDIDDPISGVVVVEDAHANRVDLLLGIRGMDPKAAERSILAPLLGGTVSIVTAEDLIAMKLLAGGAQDMEDVRGILYVSGQRLDRELLKSLVEPYGPDVARQLEALCSSDEL